MVYQIVYSVVIFSHRCLDSDQHKFKNFCIRGRLIVHLNIIIQHRHDQSSIVFEMDRASTMLNNVYKTVFTREQSAQFEWSFELRTLNDHSTCVHKFTSRCVIWIAQFKWRSGLAICYLLEMRCTCKNEWYTDGSYLRMSRWGIILPISDFILILLSSFVFTYLGQLHVW